MKVLNLMEFHYPLHTTDTEMCDVWSSAIAAGRCFWNATTNAMVVRISWWAWFT